MPLDTLIYVAVCCDCASPTVAGGPTVGFNDITKDIKFHISENKHRGLHRPQVFVRQSTVADHALDTSGCCILCKFKWPCPTKREEES